MTDQVQNLSERDISAEAIHAATSPQDIKSIMKRILGDAGAAKGKKKKVNLEEEEEDGGEIKLVYVTPERIDKSKTFVSTLQKMYDAGKISRCESKLLPIPSRFSLTLPSLLSPSLFRQSLSTKLTVSRCQVTIIDLLTCLFKSLKYCSRKFLCSLSPRLVSSQTSRVHLQTILTLLRFRSSLKRNRRYDQDSWSSEENLTWFCRSTELDCSLQVSLRRSFLASGSRSVKLTRLHTH